MYECTSKVIRDFYAFFPQKKISKTYIRVFNIFITLEQRKRNCTEPVLMNSKPTLKTSIHTKAKLRFGNTSEKAIKKKHKKAQ